MPKLKWSGEDYKYIESAKVERRVYLKFEVQGRVHWLDPLPNASRLEYCAAA